MAVTTIHTNEWNLKDDGRVVPILHFDPITINGKMYGQIYAHSYWWLMERGLGVGAIIFVETNKQNKAHITHLNVPAIPNLVIFCACGKLLHVVGRHLQCLEPEKKCPRRGTHAWLNTEPLSWVNSSIIYPPEVWTYFRDTPNYFKPRKVENKYDTVQGGDS